MWITRLSSSVFQCTYSSISHQTRLHRTQDHDIFQGTSHQTRLHRITIFQSTTHQTKLHRIMTFFKVLHSQGHQEVLHSQGHQEVLHSHKGTKRLIDTNSYPESRSVRIPGTSPGHTKFQQQICLRICLRSIPRRQTRSFIDLIYSWEMDQVLQTEFVEFLQCSFSLIC